MSEVSLRLSYQTPTKEMCEMCGEEKATCVVLDPNVFPDNGPDDTMDVCDDCAGFIDWGTEQNYKIMATVALREKGQEVAGELLPDPVFQDVVDKIPRRS